MKALTRNPNIMHGKPCIAGTRIPSELVRHYAEDGYTAVQIMEQYPLTFHQIEGALRYEYSVRVRLARWIEGYRQRLGYWLIREDME